MTERGRTAVARSATTLRIGRSTLAWDATGLTIEIDEITAPIPARLRGTVRITAAAFENRRLTLDQAGRHRWSPIAPCARAEVAFTTPARRWSGPAYFDTNDGDAPLERDFAHWHWCRAPLGDGGTAVLYEVARRDGTGLSLAMRYARSGGVADFEPPPPAPLPPSRWGVARPTRAEGGARVLRTLEDAPFYSRSVLATTLLGQPVTAIHESLSLDRFATPWVQAMLPFRIPRRGRWAMAASD